MASKLFLKKKKPFLYYCSREYLQCDNKQSDLIMKLFRLFKSIHIDYSKLLNNFLDFKEKK